MKKSPSSLLNPRRTRTRILGVLTDDNTQLCFLDTPGFHKPKTKLSGHMNNVVKNSIGEVDLVLFLVEPMGAMNEQELELIETFKARKLPVILVVNKIDLIDKEQILQRIAEISALYPFTAVVPVSVTGNNGVSLVLDELKKNCPEGPSTSLRDTLTDQPERTIAAEVIREKILRNMRDEVPHGTAVVIEKMRERENNPDILDIEATHLLRTGKSQGDDYRQGRPDAEKKSRPMPAPIWKTFSIPKLTSKPGSRSATTGAMMNVPSARSA